MPDLPLFLDLKLEEESSTETLESLNIQFGAFLDFCVRTPGGSRSLQPLPGYIEVTTAPCDVSCDDDPSVNRAKMPCGCVIGRSMYREPTCVTKMLTEPHF